METELHEKKAEASGELYVIQMVLAINPYHPRWHTVGFEAFKKNNVLFIHHPDGEALMKCLDTPPSYMGGRFIHSAAFTSMDSAQKFLRAAKEGNWHGGNKTRIALYTWHEAIEANAPSGRESIVRTKR